MAERIPIYLTPTRKSNSTQVPFEIKAFGLYVIISLVAFFYLLLNFKVPHPAGFVALGAMYGALLRIAQDSVYEDQSPQKQLYYRIQIMMTLLLWIVAGWIILKTTFISEVYVPPVGLPIDRFTLFTIFLPAFWLVVIAIRFVPMFLNYRRTEPQNALKLLFKLSRKQR